MSSSFSTATPADAGHAHPEGLVETDWLAADHLDPTVRVFEIDVDTDGYAQGHIAGAVHVPWSRFVLRSLLGHRRVRNDDGSWTEWGSLIGAPIETGGPA